MLANAGFQKSRVNTSEFSFYKFVLFHQRQHEPENLREDIQWKPQAQARQA
jgi:hypothetical protein